MTITIVSAFIRNMNNREDYKTDAYLENGKLLLKTAVNKVIFLDQDTYNELKEFQNEQTKFIITTSKDIYLYQYTHLLTHMNISTKNPQKDTTDYFYLMCNKTEFVKQAIDMNLFNSDNFVWIDFGIRYIFTPLSILNDQIFMNSVERLNNISYNNVRIGSIWKHYQQSNTNDNPFTTIIWQFAGGVFGGNKEQLIRFATLTKEMCLRTIFEHNTIMWEVNIWHLVYKEYPEIFDLYPCDHNNSILDNY